jgi:hypothetical protein
MDRPDDRRGAEQVTDEASVEAPVERRLEVDHVRTSEPSRDVHRRR